MSAAGPIGASVLSAEEAVRRRPGSVSYRAYGSRARRAGSRRSRVPRCRGASDGRQKASRLPERSSVDRLMAKGAVFREPARCRCPTVWWCVGVRRPCAVGSPVFLMTHQVSQHSVSMSPHVLWGDRPNRRLSEGKDQVGTRLDPPERCSSQTWFGACQCTVEAALDLHKVGREPSQRSPKCCALCSSPRFTAPP